MTTNNEKPFESWPKALQLAHVACDGETAEMLRQQHAELTRLRELYAKATDELALANKIAAEASEDTKMLDYIQSYGTCFPTMDGNHVWGFFPGKLTGPTLRDAIAAKMKGWQ